MVVAFCSPFFCPTFAVVQMFYAPALREKPADGLWVVSDVSPLGLVTRASPAFWGISLGFTQKPPALGIILF